MSSADLNSFGFYPILLLISKKSAVSNKTEKDDLKHGFYCKVESNTAATLGFLASTNFIIS